MDVECVKDFMRHFLFEDKEYRINPHFKRKRKELDSAAALARLIKRFSGKKTNGTRKISSPKGKRLKSRYVDARQNCVAKMNYSFSMGAHLKQINDYLIREGKGIDGGKPELYGTDIDEYKANMVNKNYRIFLSPQSDKINLNDLAEKFIKKLEQQTGYSFYWQAANHYNTGHPHTHLLINGKDKNGKEIDIPRDVVKTFMREYARDVCTSQIGLRTQAELALEKDKELEAQRFTKLDEYIKKVCDENLSLDTKQVYQSHARILARIENLKKMGLCSYVDGRYKFSPEWEEDLRANSRYNVFLKARSELKYNEQAKLKVYTGEMGAISGRVTKVYRIDEDISDNHVVILETFDGQAFFIPLFKQPVMYAVKGDKGQTKVKENDVISIETYKSQKGRLTPLIFDQAVSQQRKNWLKDFYSGKIKPDNIKTKTVTASHNQ